MAIVLDNNRITCDTGTITMDVLYNESVAQGWNIQKFGRVFLCPYNLYFTGDANFHLGYTSNGQILNFNYSHTTDVYSFYFNSTGYCYIGREDLVSAGNNLSACISNMDVGGSNNKRVYFAGNVRIINSLFTRIDYLYVFGNTTHKAIVKRTIFNAVNFGLGSSLYTDVYNTTMIGGTYAMNISTDIGVVDGFICNSNTRGILVSGGVLINVKNVIVQNQTSSDTFIRCGSGALRTVNFIDCVIDKNKMAFYISGTATSTNKQVLLSTYNFNTKDNSSIKVYDKDNNLVLDSVTDVDGNLISEIKYYERTRYTAGGAFVGDEVIIDYEPFKIEISKTGYETTTIEDVYVTAGQPTIIRATLKYKEYYDKPFNCALEEDIIDIELIEEETQ